MDYHVLANELLRKIYVINKDRPQRKLNECMRGEGFVLQYVIFHEGPVQPNEISSFAESPRPRRESKIRSFSGCCTFSIFIPEARPDSSSVRALRKIASRGTAIPP